MLIVIISTIYIHKENAARDQTLFDMASWTEESGINKERLISSG